MDFSSLLEPYRGQSVLLEYKAKAVLRQAGLRVPEGIWIPAGGKLPESFSLGYPLAAKASSRQFASKSEVRGVRLGIHGRTDLEREFQGLSSIPHCEGVLIEEMAPSGVEVIVGSVVDPQFGPIVMFGLGGIFTEIFKDVSFGLAPLDRERALRAVRQIRGYPVLEEYRGRPAVNQEALADVMIAVAGFMATGMVEEIDLNPVALYPEGALVLDAKVKLKDRNA